MMSFQTKTNKNLRNYSSADESEEFDDDDGGSSTGISEKCTRKMVHSKRRIGRRFPDHEENDDDDVDDEDDYNDSDHSSQLLSSDVIEILKNYAACKEKQFRWEQSKSTFQQAPDSDPNKKTLTDIINFADGEKQCTRDQAIYLYDQLGQKCLQHKNFIGAAKAFERAASLRYDLADEYDQQEPTIEDVSATVSYLEAAIENYAAIHKYKHAGTLHYRCSRILSRINAPHRQVDKHHEKALEYFTKPDHEVKFRKRIDGMKISCYSSYSSHEKMHNDVQSLAQHMTTTTTTTNMIKFHQDEHDDDDDDDDDDVSNDSIGRHTSLKPMHARNRNKNFAQSAQYYSRSHTASYSSSCSNERPRIRARLSDDYYACTRTIEHRIEAAQKLVKKLRRQFPFYEVSASGPERGRVFCRVCKRHLGAVSSTLKNHANTQEHQQAVQEEEEEVQAQQQQQQQHQIEIHKKIHHEQSTTTSSSSKNDFEKDTFRGMKRRRCRTNKFIPLNQYKLNPKSVRPEMGGHMSGLFEMAPDLRDIELQPLTPSFSGHFDGNQASSTAVAVSATATANPMALTSGQNPALYSYLNTNSAVPSNPNVFVSGEMFQMNSMSTVSPLNTIDSYS